MLAPVDFDDQLGIETTEVDYVRTDHFLSAKSRPANLTRSQSRPEKAFRVGFVSAKLASVRSQ
jgi:hypothetical protein